MDETELNIREEIIRTGIRMNELDINQGTSGNISVRWKEGILLTPTGIPLCGTSTGRYLSPKSEWKGRREVGNFERMMISFGYSEKP